MHVGVWTKDCGEFMQDTREDNFLMSLGMDGVVCVVEGALMSFEQ